MVFLSSIRKNIQLQADKYKNSQAAIGAFWIISGTAGGQLIRLASNLLLTRLLFPEIFGSMAIVYAVIIGLSQISDVGIREGVVNSSRVTDPSFMRTAWTIQILRGLAVALIAIVIAPLIANFYNEEILAPAIAMTGLGIFITGFKSVSPLAYDKRLELKTQIILSLVVQIAGLIVVLIWAYISPTIWALVAGQLVSSVMEVIFSYLLFKGHHSKLSLDKASVKELINFGKWILVSSTISYVIVQGDKLVMGVWLSMSELGLYSIAANWSAIVALVSVQLSTRVLHPFFRQKIELNADFSQIHRIRLRLNLLYVIACAGLAIIGDKFISFLYDDRYLGAGWILQVLAVGQIGRVFTGTLRPFLTANGDSFSQMIISAISAIILVAFIVAGGAMSGSTGVIIAYAVAGIVMHPVMIIFAKKHGYHCGISDMGLALFATGFIMLIWWLMDAPVVQVFIELLK